MEGLTNRQKQAIASRQNILETAFALTNEIGFDNVTIQDICKKAGVSVGAFYHYFDSKEALVLSWYDVVDKKFGEEVVPRLLKSRSLTDKKLLKFFKEQVLFTRQYGSGYIAQLYRAQCSVSNTKFYSNDRDLVHGLTEIIRQGQKKKELRDDMEAEEIRDALLIIIRGILLDWAWHEGSYDIEKRVETMFKPYLEYISKEKTT